ncbi:unnamed protein product [Prunus armeniaca]
MSCRLLRNCGGIGGYSYLGIGNRLRNARKLKQPNSTQSEIRQVDKVRLKVLAVHRVYPRFLFTQNLIRARLVSPTKMVDARRSAKAKRMNESSKRRLMLGLREKKKRRQSEAVPVHAAKVDPEDQTFADRLRQLSAEPVPSNLDAESVPKRGWQKEASRAVFAAEEDDSPTEPITITCPSKTVQFADHMIPGSQMELFEIAELLKRVLQEDAGRAFRLQALASMDIWLLMKRTISATERAKKAYDDGSAKASEAKLAEMRVVLDFAVTMAKDAKAAKGAVQAALEESERAKAVEIDAAVREAIRGYRTSEEFTVLLDNEVGSEMADLHYRFKRFNPGQKLNLNFEGGDAPEEASAAEGPAITEGARDETIADEGDEAAGEEATV